MTAQSNLIETPPTNGPTPEPKTRHAPRAVINRLLEGAKALERDAVMLIVKMDGQASDEAHACMDVARSLTAAAKWLEGA